MSEHCLACGSVNPLGLQRGFDLRGSEFPTSRLATSWWAAGTGQRPHPVLRLAAGPKLTHNAL